LRGSASSNSSLLHRSFVNLALKKNMKIGPLSPKFSKKIKVANFFLRHRLRSLAPFGLFVLYVADLADIINQHGVTLHSFADDTQLYLHCCREDITTAATRLKECIMDVGRWMSANRLKLNMDKTELLWTGSRHSISQLDGHGPSIQLGASTISACDHVCLLGVMISADFSLDRHLSVVSSASFYTGYDSFDEFADLSTMNRQPYWFTPSLRSGSTIAICCCWPEHQSLLPTSCSGS